MIWNVYHKLKHKIIVPKQIKIFLGKFSRHGISYLIKIILLFYLLYFIKLSTTNNAKGQTKWRAVSIAYEWKKRKIDCARHNKSEWPCWTCTARVLKKENKFFR